MIDAFFRRQTPEEQHETPVFGLHIRDQLRRRRLVIRAFEKVRHGDEFGFIKTMLGEFFRDEMARANEGGHGVLNRARMPLVEAIQSIERIHGQRTMRATTDKAIVLPTATAILADAALFRVKMIGGADQLVIMQRVGNRNLALYRGFQNRIGQVVINAMRMDDIRLEIVQQLFKLFTRFSGVEKAWHFFDLVDQATAFSFKLCGEIITPFGMFIFGMRHRKFRDIPTVLAKQSEMIEMHAFRAALAMM